MNVRVFAIAVAVALLVLGGAAYFLIEPPAGNAPADARSPATAPAPVPAPEPAPSIIPPRPRATGPGTGGPPDASAATETTAATATTGTLVIDSDVPEAQVFIDRKLIGRVPATAENIAPGSHRLNVEAEGFEGVAETIEVAPGRHEMTIRLREVRLNTAITVVHKHRIGSCEGRLSATPDGIRYDTANRDDGFQIALADLETFEVDYLEKNLRVKARGDRQFNFTDPQGDADRLFVFHRDVTNARERAAKGDEIVQ